MGERWMVIIAGPDAVFLPLCEKTADKITRTGNWLRVDGNMKVTTVCEDEIIAIATETTLKLKQVTILANYQHRLLTFLENNGYSLIDGISHIYATV